MPEMRTTTLIINAPIDPQPLDAQFKLVRYDVPERFKFVSRNNKTAFARLHIQVRSQIWQPYHFYTHDQLGPSDHALYVLYADNDPVRTIGLPLLNVDELPQRTISFGDLPHHMIIKLLQAQYFGVEESVRFTSQGKHFLLARVGDRRFIGLEIELKGAKTNNEREGSQTYRIIGHATRFIRISPEELSNQQLYTYEYVQRLEPRGGQYLLSVVPPDKVRDCPNPLYRIYREPGSRPSLDYHAQRNYKQTRGYLLFTYISAFVEYLVNRRP